MIRQSKKIWTLTLKILWVSIHKEVIFFIWQYFHTVYIFDAFYSYSSMLHEKDWTYQKIEEQRGRPKRDYATANKDPKQIVLTSIWVGIILVFF